MALSDKPFPLLQNTLKGKYPFRIGTTSFIYPDDYSENVRLLAPFFDEIELIFFESEALPEKEEIKALSQIREEYDITYNIHLPTDIEIGSFDKAIRQKAVDSVVRTFDLAGPLAPTTYTLHIPNENKQASAEDVKKWQDAAIQGIHKIVAHGIPPGALSIENLMYPFEWFECVVKELDLSVTMDVGHLIVQERNISDMAKMFEKRLSMMHLHGVDRSKTPPKDHVPVGYLTEDEVESIRNIFTTYENGVSIEIFSFDKLNASLDIFESLFPTV